MGFEKGHENSYIFSKDLTLKPVSISQLYPKYTKLEVEIFAH